ncbi:hypothetical protein PQC16_gp181 [Rhizobium phage RHph_TM30]|uniref:Uncharacterized protein n=1 Tax=Rhizobium phage RHph_TM30 TaxID=2509764 RepID=A0A7S5UXJ9_9CAUD|nr:hypothetical protein PQC16_gp181 [Rhizobium phage RHph_TM30]QIG71288.1 hypothetical protein EVB93_181 [Rhizobium phage RHph_TM30]
MSKVGDLLQNLSDKYVASDELRQSRLDICATCPFSIMKKFTIELNICDSCGCVISQKTKIKSAECPEGKW